MFFQSFIIGWLYKWAGPRPFRQTQDATPGQMSDVKEFEVMNVF